MTILVAQGYQTPTELETTATASNTTKGSVVDRGLRHGLLSEPETIFGSPFDVASWLWTAPSREHDGSDSDKQEAHGPSTLEAASTTKSGRAHLDGRLVLDEAVWAGQWSGSAPPPPGETNDRPPAVQTRATVSELVVAHPNAQRAIWAPSNRGWRYPQVILPWERFVSHEELTGRFDKVEDQIGTVACTIWRRRQPDDEYTTELRLAEFPDAQQHQIREGRLFYWTFGDLLQGRRRRATSSLVVKRPTPKVVADRLYAIALLDNQDEANSQ